MSNTKSNTATCDLLTWKDPIKTAEVFGGILAGLIIFKTVNLVNIFFHLAYLGLLVGAAAEYAGKLILGHGLVTKYKPAGKDYSMEFNDNVLPLIGDTVKEAFKLVQKIVFVEDIETTLKAAGVSYILYKVTSWFSLFTLTTLALIAAFTVPAIYTRNKKEIDAAVAQYSKIAKDKTAELSKTAHEKAAPHLEKFAAKTGPIGAFVKKNLPSRTAGSTVGKSTSSTFDDAPPTATTTGATKFPEVPTAKLDGSEIKEFVDETKAKVPESI